MDLHRAELVYSICEFLTRGNTLKISKVTAKGQVTIPVEFRRKLKISEEDHVAFESDGECLTLRKIVPVAPLGPDDPMWNMLGSASGGKSDVARRHDDYLAEGETTRWRKS